MMPGAQNKGTYAAIASELTIKMPTMKSRQRFFWIISPSQVLHFIPDMFSVLTFFAIHTANNYADHKSTDLTIE
jgi:hypothetical protein